MGPWYRVRGHVVEVPGDEMEVELSADTLDYVIFNSRLLRLAMWSTLTPRMLATPSWSVLVLAYIFFILVDYTLMSTGKIF